MIAQVECKFEYAMKSRTKQLAEAFYNGWHLLEKIKVTFNIKGIIFFYSNGLVHVRGT
jgi:hypothetical protein